MNAGTAVAPAGCSGSAPSTSGSPSASPADNPAGQDDHAEEQEVRDDEDREHDTDRRHQRTDHEVKSVVELEERHGLAGALRMLEGYRGL